MPAATARSAPRLSQVFAVVTQDLLDPDDLPFRGSLAALTLAAGAFSSWVASTPPRVHDAVADVEAAVVHVLDLPRIVLPVPEIEPVRVPEITQPRPERAARPKPVEAAARAAQGAPDGRPRSLLLRRLGERWDGKGPVAEILEEIDADDTWDILRTVSNDQAAVVGDSLMPRRGRRDGDVDVGIGRLGGGRAETGDAAVKVKADVRQAPEEVRVDGGGDAAAITSIVRASQGSVTTCVERSLKGNPSLSGRVEVRWSIVRGRVEDAELLGDTTGDPALGACVVRAVAGFRFPVELTADVARFPWAVSGR